MRLAAKEALTPYRHFVNALAATAALSANRVAKGSAARLGCRLNGSARQTTHVSTSSGKAERLAQWRTLTFPP